jgi:hypothetical protein
MWVRQAEVDAGARPRVSSAGVTARVLTQNTRRTPASPGRPTPPMLSSQQLKNARKAILRMPVGRATVE